MSRQNLFTVVISVTLSIFFSTAINLVLVRRERTYPDIVRARKVELVDAQGRTMGAFQLASDGQNGDSPLLVMRNRDGRDVIELGVGNDGNGVLSFASEHWNEGALILGHLNLVDAQSIDHPSDDANHKGAWGLQVRSPQSIYTGIGFFNSGRPIAPIPSPAIGIPHK